MLSTLAQTVERRRAAPIGREEWDKHKERLRGLIIEKRLPWKDIIIYMQENHAFYATKAQYHKQCRDWGIFKNKKRARIELSERSNSHLEALPNDAAHDLNLQTQLTEDIASTTQLRLCTAQRSIDRVHVIPSFDPSSILQLWDRSVDSLYSTSGNSSSAIGGAPGLPLDSTSVNSQSSFPIGQNADYNPLDGDNYSNHISEINNFDLPTELTNGLLPSPLPTSSGYCGGAAREGGQFGYPTGQNQASLIHQLALHNRFTGSGQHNYNASPPGSFYRPNGTHLFQEQLAQPNKQYQVPGLTTVPQPNNSPGGKSAVDNASSTGPLATEGIQPIHAAARECSLRGVELLLKADPDCANVLTTGGASALIFAAAGGNARVVQIFLDHGLDVNLATTHGRTTPLHQAAANGFLDIVELLLGSNAMPDSVDSKGLTPLWYAAQKGSHRIVELLLKSKANPDTTSITNHRRPIHQAAQRGYTEVVKLLLDAGVKPDEKDHNGITPLWIASQEGYHDIVKLLFGVETTINVEAAALGSRRAIHQAAQGGHVKVVELLLKHGAEADPKEKINDDGVPSPLLLAAAYNGSVEIARLLVGNHADINFTLKPKGCRPLHQAAACGHTDFVRFAIENGAELNAAGENGRPPIMEAAQQGHLETVTLLIDMGADVNAKQKDGGTALLIASEQGHAGVVKKLLDSGAKSYPVISNSRRPIHQAAQNGHFEVVKLLIEHDQGELKMKDAEGWTPLTFASQKSTTDNYFEIMSYLVKKEAEERLG